MKYSHLITLQIIKGKNLKFLQKIVTSKNAYLSVKEWNNFTESIEEELGDVWFITNDLILTNK